MSDPFAGHTFPKGALYGAAALIGLTLVLAIHGRATKVAQEEALAALENEITEIHKYKFLDQSDGSIKVYDAQTGAVVQTVAPGEDGFIRGVLRGLSRQRKRRDIGREAPFHLIRMGDGRLTLSDPSTGETIDLGSFGPTNEAAFARLLTPGSDTP